ncbi:MAG: MarR family transcriptional regulator [Gemmatimonadaceae bacterium]
MTPTVREEIRQAKSMRSLEQEAYLNLVRTAAVLNDRLERVLKPVGVTLAQYNVLRILRGADPDGLCRNEVRDRMVTRMPDMTRLLDRMKDAGLVRRQREDADRRMVRTVVTAKGRRVLEQIDDAVHAEHLERLGHLSRSELRALINTLERLRVDS